MPMSPIEQQSFEAVKSQARSLEVANAVLQRAGEDQERRITDLRQALENARREHRDATEALKKDNDLVRERLAKLETFKDGAERNTFTLPATITLFVAVLGVVLTAVFSMLNYLRKP